MIEVSVRLRCNECSVYFEYNYWDEFDTRGLLLAAELRGWKVNRLAKDVYFGSAWCERCRDDKCIKCNGRGYYPNFKNWDSYHGEPERKECEDCGGRGH